MADEKITAGAESDHAIEARDFSNIVADDCNACDHARTSHVRELPKSHGTTACAVSGCKCSIFIEKTLQPKRLTEIRHRVAERSRIAAPDDRRLLLGEVDRLTTAICTWKARCEVMWKLLDDVSTLNDAARDDDAAFRRAATKVAESRLKCLVSRDGHTLEEP